MPNSKRRGKVSVTHFHLVEADAGKGIRHFDEVHELGLFTVEEYLEAMHQAGFQSHFEPNSFTQDRGLLVGTLSK